VSTEFHRKRAAPSVLFGMTRFLAYLGTDPIRRFQFAVALGLCLIVVGAAGYIVIEHYPILDAFYMTIITLSTVGYGEVHPLHPAGKIFTMLLLVFGLGIAAWALSTLFEVLISDQSLRILEQRRMDRLIDTFENHFIVCGYGKIGEAVTTGFLRRNVQFVVVDGSPDRLERLRESGVPRVTGDASDDEVLTRAGIARARALIVVTSTDASNTFITLSARQMRADLMIVARAALPGNVRKLYQAGATKVISPDQLGGWWMAITAENPAVTDFITGLSEASVSGSSLAEVKAVGGIVGKTFGHAMIKERSGALALAVKREGVYNPNPPDNYVILAGDDIIALGTPAQVAKLRKLCRTDRFEAWDAGESDVPR